MMINEIFKFLGELIIFCLFFASIIILFILISIKLTL